MKRYQIQALAALLMISGFTLHCFGGVWLEAESTYKGDGVFRYRVSSRQCSMISATTLCGLSFPSSNSIAVNPPQGWVLEKQNDDYFSWAALDESIGSQLAPYDAVFEVRSSYTNFQVGSGFLTMRLTLYEFPTASETQGPTPIYSTDIVGYWRCPVLAPCSPEAADGSASTLVTNLSIPDIVITRLIREGQAIRGIAFNSFGFESGYDGPGTYLLEGTSDWVSWKKAAYIYGEAGENVWTNNVTLNHWGNFFRLQYVGFDHIKADQLPPLDGPAINSGSTLIKPAKASLAFSSLTTVKTATSDARDQVVAIQVSANAIAGRNYKVTVFNAGKEVWSTQVAAKDKNLVVAVPIGSLPPSGIIKTTELSGL